MAISKIAKAKIEMLWTKDSPKCVNCKNYSSEMQKHNWTTREKNKRCDRGGFATKLTAWCTKHEFK